jgi:hypothetical protein
MRNERLARLKIAGFGSLRSVSIELEPLTVLIGPNGPLTLEAAGLALLRGRCPRFAAWIARLETLGA